MSWDQYVDSLMGADGVQDAAILGCESGKEAVWASCKTGVFGSITPAEIRQLVVSERSSLFSGGLTLAGTKCTVLRDALNQDGQFTMDLRTKASEKDPDTYNISVAKSNKVLVIVKGKKDTHGGKLNPKVFGIADHLRKSGY
ncbi:profilin-1 [Megalops cyprinoides]|uniref:profilin-1 n=1 Tax=Megalops cyprinoides TaxID=118141 RepID=UPI001864D006|nr:profilin-1 [Megalops cyprinoides]